jgi:hypothetical protein
MDATGEILLIPAFLAVPANRTDWNEICISFRTIEDRETFMASNGNGNR